MGTHEETTNFMACNENLSQEDSETSDVDMSEDPISTSQLENESQNIKEPDSAVNEPNSVKLNSPEDPDKNAKKNTVGSTNNKPSVSSKATASTSASQSSAASAKKSETKTIGTSLPSS